jgi:hypothetical protein
MRRALVLVLIVIAGAAWWLWPTDARRVRARLTSLAGSVSVPAGESDLQRLARIASLGGGLAPDVVVEAGEDGVAVRGREAVIGLASRLGTLSGPTEVRLSRIQVEVDAGRGRASADAVVEIDTGGEGTVRQFDGQLITFELTRTSGSWLLTRVRPAATLVL